MASGATPAKAAALGRKVQTDEAARLAANILPVIDSIRASGIVTLAADAEALNARGVPASHVALGSMR